MPAVIRPFKRRYYDARSKATPVWARIPWLWHDHLLFSPLPRRRPVTLDFAERCALQRVRCLVEERHAAGQLAGDIWIYPGDDTDEGRAVAAAAGAITEAWLCRRAADNLVLAA